MNTYVIGDIHGGLKALEQVMNKVKFQENDTIIFLGDYVDGWSDSKEVIEYLITLNQKRNCIFLRGNHDDLLLNYLKTKEYNNEWLQHGGQTTKNAYSNLNQTLINQHIAFLEALLPYHIDEENRLFIHAGFTNLKGVTFEYFKPLFYWDRTLWECALGLNPELNISDPYYPKRFKLYKEIYIGHTPVTLIGKSTPYNVANIWNIDTGAAFKGAITILNIHTKQFWQSQPVNELYPEEKGRN
ncbi:Serine/threonine protein phosphatase [Flavobacterium sp. 9AF]|uniref:metallophosphoesterase family protein n=1 Tax=Flavobacterium sp. 9AF TaxID=2653142 RepID=UPI0012F3762E|nr:metallophosphoesterase family protein [Flavobacterium sp. 9AF]VXB82048.1 Serine/threonine protein phosphatase [Flavobacterium sp. 9AF]